VDHIEPSKGREDVFKRTANHIALCVCCHNTVTGKFDYKFKKGDSLQPKIEWMNKARDRNEVIQNRKFPAVKVLIYG
jgi:hypothetical protein